MARLKLGFYVLLSVTLLGCGSASVPTPIPPSPAVAAKWQIQEKFWQQGLSYRAGGRLAEALESFKIVDAVNPGKTGLQAQIADVKLEIDSRKSALLDSARWAFEQGDSTQGLNHLLRALALQPTDDGLRQQISARYRLIAESQIASRPEIRAGSSDDESLEVASVAPATDEVNDQANSLFEQGLLLIDSDPDGARTLLLKALDIDPTHVGARAYLDLL